MLKNVIILLLFCSSICLAQNVMGFGYSWFDEPESESEQSVLSSVKGQSLLNYPNPFSGTTTIGFGLSKDAHITLRVFDSSGNEVHEKTTQSLAGYNTILFDKDLPSGIYFYLIESGGQILGQSQMGVLP